MRTAFRWITNEELQMKTARIGSAALATASASAMAAASAMPVTFAMPAAFAVLAVSTAALAADIGHGEQLAREWCSNCHLVAPDQTSGGDGAPTFNSIAETAQERNDDLRAWLADPHPPMPNFDLTVREIDDLLAYIESLRSQ